MRLTMLSMTNPARAIFGDEQFLEVDCALGD
jgi:hypothetical protein